MDNNQSPKEADKGKPNLLDLVNNSVRKSFSIGQNAAKKKLIDALSNAETNYKASLLKDGVTDQELKESRKKFNDTFAKLVGDYTKKYNIDTDLTKSNSTYAKLEKMLNDVNDSKPQRRNSEQVIDPTLTRSNSEHTNDLQSQIAAKAAEMTAKRDSKQEQSVKTPKKTEMTLQEELAARLTQKNMNEVITTNKKPPIAPKPDLSKLKISANSINPPLQTVTINTQGQGKNGNIPPAPPIAGLNNSVKPGIGVPPPPPSLESLTQNKPVAPVITTAITKATNVEIKQQPVDLMAEIRAKGGAAGLKPAGDRKIKEKSVDINDQLKSQILKMGTFMSGKHDDWSRGNENDDFERGFKESVEIKPIKIEPSKPSERRPSFTERIENKYTNPNEKGNGRT